MPHSEHSETLHMNGLDQGQGHSSPGHVCGDTSQRLVTDNEYASVIRPGSSELPLSEQLEPIAVVGMGCRLPGDVRSPGEFWDMMISKRTGQTPKVPSSRFNIDAHGHENNNRPGSFSPLGGYFLQETLQEFEPSFFGITPVEAMWMDPQQRKLLEVVYEAFESAGVSLDRLAGSETACFVATFTADFQQMCFKEPSFRHNLAATGVDPGIISNRISHVFNLKGPSIVVNTACSSSVYAIHNACNALRNRECSAAIVGGSNLILTVDQHMNTAKLGVLSPTSTCHTFNSHADGYGRAEGVGAVYIKLLRDAIRDGDPVRGVIRSTATNNNGRAPGVGITHPSLEGQRDVIEHAYRRGGLLDPLMTAYFECHGTGTPVGDPLEVRAVAHSMTLNRDRPDTDGPLLIGAVKTSIGHSEAASGLSALIKAILTVERAVIPPTHGITSLNPAIQWGEWKVKVPTEPTGFSSGLALRRVSVNSFGYGGTNAHIIVESADSLLALPQTYKLARKNPNRTANHDRDPNRPFLLPFSAHDVSALKRNIEALAAVTSDYNLLDLSYTLANCRTRFSARGFVVTSRETMGNAFKSADTKFADTKIQPKSDRGIGFAFTGQGAQWAGMGAELVKFYSSFLRSIRKLDMILKALDDAPGWTLEDLLVERDATVSRVNEAEFSQPLCTALQIALVDLLLTWGIKPAVTVGHSSGEIAAAYAAGFISAAEAIVLAFYRGKVAREICTNGAMLAVGLGAHEVGPYLDVAKADGRVVIACHNSPSSVTLSGDAPALEPIRQALIANDVFTRLLKTDGKAYHSHHMAPAAAKYDLWVRSAKAKLGLKHDDHFPSWRANMVSSVTNTILSDDHVLDETYWSRNLLSPVLFNEAVQTICSNSEFADIGLIIEVGPHSALAGPIRQIKVANDFQRLEYLPTLTRGVDCAISILKLAGALFVRNHAFDIRRATSVEELDPKTGKIRVQTGNQIVDLPPYQWDRTKKFWAESRTSYEHRNPNFPRHDLLGSLIAGGSLAEPTWRNVLRIKDVPWLKDHRLGGEAVFPAAGYFSMAIEAITQLNEMQESPKEIDSYVLRDVVIQQALVTPDDDAHGDDGVEVMLNMRLSSSLPGSSSLTSTNPWWEFNISSVSTDGKTRKIHMAGKISINTRQQHQRPAAREVPQLPQKSSGKAWNQALKTVGFEYGPTFQDMDDITFDGKTYAAQSSSVIKTAVNGMVGESRHVLHPAAVDSCLQLMIVALWAGRTGAMTCGAVPVAADEVVIWKPTESQISNRKARAFSWVDPRGTRLFTAHSELVASDGQIVMEIKGMRCSAYEAAIPQRHIEPTKPQPYSNMVWKLDIDRPHISAAVETIAELDVDVIQFVELALFKQPGTRVLAVGLESLFVEQLSAKLPGLDLTITEDVTCIEPVDGSQNVVALVTILTVDDLEYLRHALNVGSKVVLTFPSSSSVTDISELLKTSGFSGAELVLKSRIEASTTVLSTAVCLDETPGTSYDHQETVAKADAGDILLVYHKHTGLTVVRDIKRHLEKRGFKITVSSIHDSSGLVSAATNVVVLDGSDGSSILPGIAEHEFLSLQKILIGAKNVVWTSWGSLLGGGAKPESGMASGLLRSLQSERGSLDAVTIDFDAGLHASTLSSEDIARFVAYIATEQITKVLPSVETEYCVSADGQVFISRLLPNEPLNDIYLPSSQKEPVSVAFNPDLRLVGKSQSGRVLFDFEDPSRIPALQPEYVEVRVLATGLNGADIRVLSGADFRTTFSHEIGGIVAQVGSIASRFFKVGDRVVGFSFDKFSTYQRIHHNLLQRLEPGELPQEVASLPVDYSSALYALETLAATEPGESVLILPGTGLAGQTAVHVARALNAVPYIAVKDEADIAKVMDLFNIQDRNQFVVLSANQSQLKNQAGLYEIDVVFSTMSVDESLASEVWRHIAPFGRFVQVGSPSAMRANLSLDGLPVRRGASYHTFDLLELHDRKPAVLGKLLARTMTLYRLGSIPLPLFSFKDISLLNQSVSKFTETFGANKVVILHEPCTRGGTLDVLPSAPQLTLRGDGTYLLVGCLGGLGRSLTSWMLQRGARHFAFLSRSADDAKEASLLVQDLRDSGAVVHVIRGDVAIQEDVERAIETVPADRPIRGVINAAMVLRDGMFENMTYQSWKSSVSPKVHGSWNLHKATSDLALDFFVMTSSISGTLGTPGQSNYAAANTFLDFFAHHRQAQGKPAVSLALPMVLGVGVVANNVGLEESLRRKGMYGIDEEQLLHAFEVAMLEQKQQQGARPRISHLVVGMDPAQLQIAKEEAGDDGAADPFWASDPRFKTTIHAMGENNASQGGCRGSKKSFLVTIKDNGMSPAEALVTIRQHFVAKLAKVLMMNAVEDFNEEGRSVASYGIDSMVGAEVRNWIFTELGLDITFQQLLAPTLTLDKFSELVLVNLKDKL
ncbi:hypothetical protein V8F20_010118 [Naviculisporaceae sp. PSN 640]